MNIRTIGKSLGVRHNVSFRVIDEVTGAVISTHIGHNSATNSLLTGIGHYLKGDGVLDQGWHMLSQYVPKYISLGTMGLMNQDEDSSGLPAGIGITDYRHKIYGQLSDDSLAAIGKYVNDSAISRYPDRTLSKVAAEAEIAADDAEALRYIDYLNQSPGFGADGYSSSLNNNRTEFGLGPTFENRADTKSSADGSVLLRGDIDGDGDVTTEDLRLLIDYLGGKASLTGQQLAAANLTRKSGDSKVDITDVQTFIDFFDYALDNTRNLSQEEVNQLAETRFGTFHWRNSYAPTINCELVSASFPRCAIAYRDIIPEVEAEFPKTIDVVFSAMISTGALAQFREPGRDYIFITEAGLWSERTPMTGGDNGLLAGYRIAPPNRDHWDMTIASNRTRLQKEVLKVGKNQVVQVIWKIQLGSIDQFEGIEALYPSTETLKWIEHGRALCGVSRAYLQQNSSQLTWSADAYDVDLTPTYDGSGLRHVELLYNGHSSSVIYMLDGAYDLTAIKVQLGRPSSGETSLGNLTISTSSDGITFYSVKRVKDIQLMGASDSLIIEHTLSRSVLDVQYATDIRAVKLSFDNGTVAPIAEVQIYALDAVNLPPNSTSLQWHLF